jgi:hypothetical protein
MRLSAHEMGAEVDGCVTAIGAGRDESIEDERGSTR